MTSCDASWLAHPSLSILLIALGFVELSDVSDYNEGIAKYMKILEMIVGVADDYPYMPSCHLAKV